MKLLNTILALGTAFAASAGSALAVTNFTETFNTNASNWLNVNSTAPTYNATGGIDDSGYISFTQSFTSGASGSFGAPPLQLFFRGNNSANASNDAFVGNWITSEVVSLTLSIRHGYTSALDLYARLDAGAGAGASLATGYTIAPNTWTTITIPIQEGNPPFLSYGAGTFAGVFANIQNLQFGLYVPASTTFSNLKVDIDNVSVAVVPEPHEYALAFSALLGALILFRRRRMPTQA
jgi:hypothetical protein